MDEPPDDAIFGAADDAPPPVHVLRPNPEEKLFPTEVVNAAGL
jgi:hypothetical protein